MMASFSPLTRKVVALGLLVLILLGAIELIVVPLYSLTADSLSGLEDARFRRARLESVAARPPLPVAAPVPASLYLTAPDRQRATDMLVAAISGSAGRYQVQIDTIAPLAAEASRGAAIAVTVAARGEHDKILAWINELERGIPNVHFADWSLAPDGSPSAAPAGGGAMMPGLATPSLDGAVPTVPPAAPVAAGAPLRLIFGGTAVAVWEPAS